MGSPNRIHDRLSFFKYVPLGTAKIILANHTLRWSSPLIFNDPFDVPRELLPDVSEKHIAQALARKLVSELKNPMRDLAGVNIRLRSLIEFFKTSFPLGLSAEQVSSLDQFMVDPPVGNGAQGAVQDLKRLWQMQLRERRILCLSESPLIMPMWNHYAERYTGIVLEFACLDELDSAWLQARPIRYSDEKPLTYSADGMAELLFQEDVNAIGYLNNEITFLKTPEWSYEREWRISSYMREGDGSYFSDFAFHPYELKSIILGPQFDMNELDTIAEVLRLYPQATLHHASLNAQRDIILKAL